MIIGNTIYKKETCSNSFAWAKEELEHAPDGSLFLAEKLTHAKGRQGRTWEIADGQLLITLLLKPKTMDTIATEEQSLRIKNLNMALSLGVVSPIKKYGVGLKWPNDFYSGNKKIGGEMMDVIWEHDTPKGIIFGFALNVNNTFSPESSVYHVAASLAEHSINREALLSEILVSLNIWYTIWLEKDYTTIFTAWKSEQIYLGKQVTLHLDDGQKVTGILNDIKENGDCLLGDQLIGFETIFALH